MSDQKRYIGYFRVSTARQGQSGLGLEAQKQSITQYVGDKDNLIEEFIEVETGRKNDRPELMAALAACRRHKATLIIAKLDRLARNVAFVSNLMEAGVEFIAADNPHASKLTIHVLCAVAEFECQMISERTKAALTAAKARGIRLGNPKGNTPHLEKARKAQCQYADEHAANVVPIISEIQRAGLTSYRQVAGALNIRGIVTSRGGKWHPATVRSALMRVQS